MDDVNYDFGSDPMMIDTSGAATGSAGGMFGGMSPYATGFGFGIQGFGQLMQGAGESNAMNFNAQIQSNNARAALISAKLNADKSSLLANRAIGGIEAGFGASGVEGSSGSVLDTISASAANAKLDRENILYGGQIKAINFENQASLDRMGAQSALNGSYLSGIGSVVEGGLMTAALL